MESSAQLQLRSFNHVRGWALFPPLVLLIILCVTLISGCSPVKGETESPAVAENSTQSTAPTVTATAEETSAPTIEFPPGINPLTGLPVSDSKLLKTPALLVSISHFPATARPQAGLSFAPYVFEFYITEGTTRFLTAFYGEFPYPEIPVTGNCAIRKEPFQQTGVLLGNQVWLDANKNGLFDVDEHGVGGVCINLYDEAGDLTQNTTTDTNGYYGFNVQEGRSYTIEILLPTNMALTTLNTGDEKFDSDFDPAISRTSWIQLTGDDLSRDAGLILSETFPTPDPLYLPIAQVGPVRSGRLLYAHIGGFFQSSCLIYAFASPEVLERIPQCAFVTHELSGGGYMLDIEEMKEIARQNKRNTGDIDFNYASNLYSEEPPEGGLPASKINVYISYLNQSGWVYDPLYQGWLRYVDTSAEDLAGVLFPDKDRLNGRQLHFENMIVLFAIHEVISPTNLDIHLEEGRIGDAVLFRDGRMYDIQWSTKPGAYEQETGLRRPIQFLNNDNTPAPLKPGRTWVIIVTKESGVLEESTGIWKVLFSAPAGAR
jgi:hypothetical protein